MYLINEPNHIKNNRLAVFFVKLALLLSIFNGLTNSYASTKLHESPTLEGQAKQSNKGLIRNMGHIDATSQNAGGSVAANSDLIIEFYTPTNRLLVNAQELPTDISVSLVDSNGAIVGKVTTQKSIFTLPESGVYRLKLANLTDSSLSYALSVSCMPSINTKTSSGAEFDPQTKYITKLIALAIAITLVIVIALFWRKHGTKVLLVNALLIAIGSFIALVLSEMILRSINLPIATFIEPLKAKPDPDVGYTYSQNTNFSHARAPCLAVDGIKSNSLGFRDSEWGNAKGGVAILGDSFMAALEVKDGTNTADIVESLLKVPVRNFAVSGYGPIAELETYKKFVRPYKPKIVIQYLLITNDISDSNAAMMVWESGRIYQPTGYYANGLRKTTRPLDVPHFWSIEEPNKITKILRNCYICRVPVNLIKMYYGVDIERYDVGRSNAFDEKAKNYYPDDLSEYIATRSNELNKMYDVDRRQNYKTDAFGANQSSRVWREAWGSAEASIADLAKEVVNDGATFILAPIPLGNDANPAMDRLRNLANQLNIRFLDANRVFDRAISSHEILKSKSRGEAFSFSCDGHWNPFGHVLMGAETARYLIANRLFDISDSDTLLTKIEKLQSMSPMEVLGEKALNQIYEKKIYDGNSNVPNILKTINP